MAKPSGEEPSASAGVTTPIKTAGGGTGSGNAKLLNAHLQETKKLEVGWVGRIFGDAAEKPGNIAAVALIFGLIGILVIALGMPETAASKNHLLVLFGSIITGAMGFGFGRISS